MIKTPLTILHEIEREFNELPLPPPARAKNPTCSVPVILGGEGLWSEHPGHAFNECPPLLGVETVLHLQKGCVVKWLRQATDELAPTLRLPRGGGGTGRTAQRMLSLGF